MFSQQEIDAMRQRVDALQASAGLPEDDAVSLPEAISNAGCWISSAIIIFAVLRFIRPGG